MVVNEWKCNDRIVGIEWLNVDSKNFLYFAQFFCFVFLLFFSLSYSVPLGITWELKCFMFVFDKIRGKAMPCHKFWIEKFYQFFQVGEVNTYKWIFHFASIIYRQAVKFKQALGHLMTGYVVEHSGWNWYYIVQLCVLFASTWFANEWKHFFHHKKN